MRKIISIVLIIGAVFSFSSCQKEKLDSVDYSGKQLVMKINASQADTKTVLEGTTAKWKSTDQVTVIYKKSGESSWSTADSDEASSTTSFVTATFSATLPSADASEDAYAVFPANGNAPTTTLAKAPIAAVQYPTGTSFDGNSDIMISQAFRPYPSVDVKFARVGAVLKIKIINETLADANEKLLSLSVTGPNYLAGIVGISFSSHGYYSITSGVNTVTAVYPTSNQFEVGEPGQYVYLIVRPQLLAIGSTLRISGETENYTFSKDIVISGEDIFLNAGHIMPLNISITSITAKSGWYKVDHASWLSAGDRVVIGNDDGSKLMSSTQATSNRSAVDITSSSDKSNITVFNSEAQEFILETGTAAGSFAFWCDNGNKVNNYIYAASSSDNQLKSQANLDANASFVPNISAGYGSLIAQGGNTHNILRCYSGSSFNCYSSVSQKEISIYKFYGDPSASTFRFSTTQGITALGIASPSSGSFTNLSSESEYYSGNVKMTITPGTGSSKTRIYNSSGTLDLRLYAADGKEPSTITFDAGTGKNITKVEFVPNGNSNFGLTASTGTLSEKTWTGSSQTVTFTATKSNQIFVAKVYYE